MIKQRTCWYFVVLGLVTSVALGGGLLRRSVPRKYCYLPCYEYRPVRLSNPATEVSFTILTTGPGSTFTVDGMTIRTRDFQMNATALRNDHTRVERFVMTIQDDGRWTIRLDASQNPDYVGEQRRPEFERFVHNTLYLKVRGVGTYNANGSPGGTPLAKPDYFEIELDPILLEKRQSRVIHLRGVNHDIRRYFELINQVEMDLSYR